MFTDKVIPEPLSKEDLERLDEIFKEDSQDDRLHFLEIRKSIGGEKLTGVGSVNIYTWEN
jgi:hypothetical protein